MPKIKPVTNFQTPKDISAIWKGDVESFRRQNFITFTAYSSPTINTAAVDTQTLLSHPGQRLESWSFLWPRTGFKENITHVYGTDRGNIIAEILAGLATGAKTVKGTVTGLVNLLGKKPTMNTLREDPIFFQRTERRKFDITLNLYALTALDSAGNLDLNSDIYMPIQFFKKYSHPDLPSGGSKIGTTFKYPSTFTISGGLFDNQSFMPQKTKTSRGQLLLSSMSVDYNPEVKFLDPFGLPVSAILNLSFEEIISKSKADFSEDLNSNARVLIKIKE